jgi:hypothetical protein
VQQRPDEASGDYEYDLAHEAVAGRRRATRQPAGRPGLAPTGQAAEPDQDMSYDEAHDF